MKNKKKQLRSRFVASLMFIQSFCIRCIALFAYFAGHSIYIPSALLLFASERWPFTPLCGEKKLRSYCIALRMFVQSFCIHVSAFAIFAYFVKPPNIQIAFYQQCIRVSVSRFDTAKASFAPLLFCICGNFHIGLIQESFVIRALDNCSVFSSLKHTLHFPVSSVR